jgi:RNA polymerase sigma factor (sigma-70 family)
MADDFSGVSDADLELRASQGDREAFGQLYERHCDAVHDFLLRMTRSSFDAADLTQETFIRAMSSMRPDRAASASFRTLLFTIARNAALNWLERAKRTKPASAASAEEDERVFSQIESSHTGSDPETVAMQQELASLVWKAAAALDPRQRSVLELHVRHGLESAEIADVLGVSRGNAYTILSRTKDSFESAVGGLMMFQFGSRKCPELGDLLAAERAVELTSRVQRLIDRHVKKCGACESERSQLVSPSALLRGLALLPLPFALRRRGAEAAWERVCELRPPHGDDSSDSSRDGDSLHEPARTAPASSGILGTVPINGTSTSATAKIGGSMRIISRRRSQAVVAAAIAVLLVAGTATLAVALVGNDEDRTSAVAGEATQRPTALVSTPRSLSATPAPRSTSEAGVVVVQPTTTTAPAKATFIPTTTPTLHPISTPPPTPPPPPPPPPVVSCQGFWERQPTTGAGWNDEYAAMIVGLQNERRGSQALPPLMHSPLLTQVAREYAMVVVEHRLWEKDYHVGPDGRDAATRLRDAGAIGYQAHEQNVAPGRLWDGTGENVGGTDGWDPCQMNANWGSTHWNNVLGTMIVNGVPTPPHADVVQGTACYVLYETRTVGCVQEFVFLK